MFKDCRETTIKNALKTWVDGAHLRYRDGWYWWEEGCLIPEWTEEPTDAHPGK